MCVTAATRDLVVVLWGHDSRLHEVVHADVWIQHEGTHDDIERIPGEEGYNKLQTEDATSNNNSPLLELEGPIDTTCVNTDCDGFYDFEEPFQPGHLATLEHGIYLLSSVVVVDIILDIVEVFVQVMDKEDHTNHCHELESDGDPVHDEDGAAKVAATVATQRVLVEGIVGKAASASRVEGHGHC